MYTLAEHYCVQDGTVNKDLSEPQFCNFWSRLKGLGVCCGVFEFGVFRPVLRL